MIREINEISLTLVYSKDLANIKGIFKVKQKGNNYYITNFNDENIYNIEIKNKVDANTKDFFRSNVSHFAKTVQVDRKNGFIVIEIFILSSDTEIDHVSIMFQNDQNPLDAFSFETIDGKTALVAGVSIYDDSLSQNHFIVLDNKLLSKFIEVNSKKEVSKDTNYDSKQLLITEGNVKRLRNSDKFKYILLYGDIRFTSEKEFISTSNLISIEKLKQDIKNYLNLWDRYNEKEKQIVFEDAKSHGIIKFDTHESTGKFVRLYFNDENFNKIKKLVGTRLIVGDSTILKLFKLNDNLKEYIKFEKSLETATRGELKKDYLNDADRSVKIVLDDPSVLNNLISGFIAQSLLGDATMFRRREVAKEKIITNRCGMPKMSSWFTDAPEPQKRDEVITLNHKLFDDEVKLTNNQIEAIDIICNTPDIAIVQGPPGTGKTTVINYAISQINSISKNRYNKFADNIVTGFRHETVQNITDRINLFGLPAVKVGSRNSEDEDSNVNLESKIIEYIDHLLEQLDQKYHDLKVYDEKYETFKRLYINYVSFNNSVDESIELLKQIKNLSLFKFKNDVLQKLNHLIESLEKNQQSNTYEKQQFLNLLYALPLDEAAFEDNIQTLLLDCEILRENKNIFKDVCLVYSTLTEIPINYDKIKTLRRKLIIKYRPLPKIFATVNEKEEIINLLKTIYHDLLIERLKSYGGEQVALLDYINSLNENPILIRKTILNYTKVLGATNQQTYSKELFDIRTDDTNQTFDNVFIDEAATSTPLDLFIPMSLAKKRLVLVGDHKQLPNISNDLIISQIEKDVLKSENIDTKVSEEMKESLFERLFNKAKELEKTDGIKRVITLKNQFRMHPTLGKLVSDHFYKEEGGIDSPRPQSDFVHNYHGLTNQCAHWIDVPYEKHQNYREANSRVNILEANVIAKHIKEALNHSDNKKMSIGIISMYRPQVEKIKQALISEGILDKNGKVSYNYPGQVIEYGTVDAFQGKEFDVVYLSIVYTFDTNEDYTRQTYSRLINKNLLCVALSRQKNLLIAVGNKEIFTTTKAKRLVPSLCEFKKLCE